VLLLGVFAAVAAGRTFDGVGALSAGASSRLLIDYPEPQRSCRCRSRSRSTSAEPTTSARCATTRARTATSAA
jgi:hypothetical protein